MESNLRRSESRSIRASPRMQSRWMAPPKAPSSPLTRRPACSPPPADGAGRGGRFGFVESTFYYVDLRRNEAEKWRLTYKATLNEIYRLLLGYKKLEKRPIKYEFGKHKTRQK